MKLPFKFRFHDEMVTSMYDVNKNWSCKMLHEIISVKMFDHYNFRGIKLSFMGIAIPFNSDINFMTFLNQSTRVFNYDTIGFYVDEEETLAPSLECAVCFQSPRNIVFLPCRHLVSCLLCANRIEVCIICRGQISERMQVFF
jgi:hypothetical protein